MIASEAVIFVLLREDYKQFKFHSLILYMDFFCEILGERKIGRLNVRRIHHKSKGISFKTALLCIAFVVVAVLCVTRINNLWHQRQRLLAEKAQLETQEKELTERLNQIKAAKTLNDDKEHVEDVARGQLDMVYPGEIIFRISGE